MASLTIAAYAEDLVMPFACTAAGTDVQIARANETTYRIVGRREEQPFVACPSGAASCETMMVHRFAIECDGIRVPWARVTNAARGLGVHLPAGLPLGFAPVSTMSGRFVLPALAHTAPFATRVAMQDLSPDSVMDTSEDVRRSRAPAWITEVTANASLIPMEGNAVRVAASLAGVFALLFAASMVAAGRLQFSALRSIGLPHGTINYAERAARSVSATFARRMTDWLSSLSATGGFGAQRGVGDEFASAFSIAQARLIQTELSVAALPADLLLRDVLAAEVKAIRERLSDADSKIGRYSSSKLAAIIRTILRELDRIARISQSAAKGSQPEAVETELQMPSSMAEAYRVLGINADAAPGVAKKLVDALRMSWHPDHARDESDRRRREGRMKQINAAWDLIKDRRAAA